MSDQTALWQEFLKTLNFLIPVVGNLELYPCAPFRHWPKPEIEHLALISKQLRLGTVPLRMMNDDSLWLGSPSGCESIHDHRRSSGDDNAPPQFLPMQRETAVLALSILRQWRRRAIRELRDGRLWLPVNRAAREAGTTNYNVSRLATAGKIVNRSSREGRRLIDMTSLRSFLQQRSDEKFRGQCADESDREVEAKLKKAEINGPPGMQRNRCATNNDKKIDLS